MMKTNVTAVIACVTVGLLLAGCEQGKKVESSPVAASSTAAAPSPPADLQATPAATPTPPATPKRKQRNLTCRSGWEDFCGGWTIYESKLDSGGSGAEHIAVGQRFVIGEKDVAGSKDLYVFPRGSDLKELWGNANRIKLDPIQTDGPCLTGKVELKHAGLVEWHRVTFTAEERTPEPEIGKEIELKVDFMAEPQNAPSPSSCPKKMAQPQGGLALDHGGLAHAED
jgi:hypothetical protein